MKLSVTLSATVLAAGLAASAAAGQWVSESEQFYLPASHNWVFRDHYMGADRLFNAFDYGHAILYETLYSQPNAPVERLEVEEYEFLTRKLLRNPPRVPLEEQAIAVNYARLVPEAKLMFEWAHVLHRQIYDVLADERLSMERKDAAVAELLDYYRSRPDIAFSTRPKSMDLMDAQPYSLAFRERYPTFNGLIWAYHWLQVGLYEPLLVNTTAASRTRGVNATVGRFWQMLENPPQSMPYLMPMTAAIAPTFAARYPEAAIVFDNLHMMHDVISDILASPVVPPERKRAEILRAAALFRDDSSHVIALAEWAAMGEMMGIENMGGPAVGFLPEPPTPTVPRGMSMAGMDHGRAAQAQLDAHAGHQQRADTPRTEHAGHDAAATDSANVVATVGRFHQALAAGDSTAALALLADDAVVQEEGVTLARDDYRARQLPDDIASARDARRERSALRVSVRNDVAWATSTFSSRGRPGDASAELMVLVRTPAGWRITAIHRSERPAGY